MTNQPQPTCYANRRERLLNQLPKNSLVVLATASHKLRNADADYKYRADSSFYYLTGFSEPEAVLVLDNTTQQSYHLFVRPKDKDREIWDGKRVGVTDAITYFSVDMAYSYTDLDDILPELLLGKNHVFIRFADNSFQQMGTWLHTAKQKYRGEGVPTQVHNIDSIIDDMRLIKDKHEIELMQQAADIAANAHKRAMQQIKPNMMEYALEAELTYSMAQQGATTSYNSIVAGGENACILHYVENNQPLKNGDLVLIDAGAEYQLYASDITRTFPVNGKFTQPQRELYELVLKAQRVAIEHLTPQHDCKAYHHAAIKVLTQGLIDLGILTGDLDTLIAKNAYQPFYMHGTGHWLGLDVHDVGSYASAGLVKHDNPDVLRWQSSSPRMLRAGMVLTVEPGLYMSHDNPQVPEKYKGIGIRIEDDVLITDGEPIVLTRHVPKTVADIEALMQNG